MLEVKNVCCGYNGIDIVKQVSFNINRGENLCIVGPNGCGKSTLLKAISNLISFNGEIKLDGKNINALKRKELATKIALMTQSSNIQFPYTIFETVALGRYAHLNSIFSRLSKKDEEVINESLKMVGLLDIKDKLISELSGGQLQRAGICRSLMNDPKIIFGDEPTGALNSKSAEEIMDLLRHINNKGTTIVLVTHDPKVASKTERIMFMSDGKIQSELKLSKYDGKNIDERMEKILGEMKNIGI